MSEKKLNPDITPVFVGIEEVREVKIYPLSLKDHTEKLPSILVQGYEAFRSEIASIDDINNVPTEEGLKLVDKFKTILEEHLERLLVLVTKEESRPKMEELTSNQLYKILETIFTVNYEGVLKNSINLFKRVQTLRNL